MIRSKSFYVYLHKRKSDGSVFYVGKGCGKRATSRVSRSTYWNSIVSKHGLTVEVAFTGLQEWYAFELEAELILKYGSPRRFGGKLANHNYGGYGGESSNHRLAERTPEYRKKISDGLKAWYSENQSATLGTKHKPLHSQKISIAKKGKKLGGDNPFAREIICVNTGQEFDSIVDASQWVKDTLGTNTTRRSIAINIGKVLRGEFKQHLGFTWKYKKENKNDPSPCSNHFNIDCK